MSITYDDKNRVFKLDTPRTSYCVAIVDGKWLGHIYYGTRISTTDILWSMRLEEPPCTPLTLSREEVNFRDSFPWEYPVANIGDFRTPCLTVRTSAGQIDALPVFAGYSIIQGKPTLDGLPATFGRDDDCSTLIITLRDRSVGVKVDLYYTAFGDVDAITRSAKITYEGEDSVTLARALSSCIDIPYSDGMEVLTLPGSWGRERSIQREQIGYGYTGTGSVRGVSGHQEHPFIAVLDKERVWAMNFVYSGNFIAQVERDQYDTLRVVMGIHPDNFQWMLKPSETFQTPETVLVFSDGGLDNMTHTFHDLYRGHLMRSPYLNAQRPVLINNWEATYFDFNEERLLSIARKAASLGIELFVLDDGWFGWRDSDSSSLGDWYVNTAKLPNGLRGLSEKLRELGMKFGIWMEPEMISRDSDVYRAHPDWAIGVCSRGSAESREQLVLDLTRPEVEEYVYRCISDVLRSADISYLKWDMNRNLADVGSMGIPAERQGEIAHRYMLAVYRLQERLVSDFPELLLENCSSGGGRYDPGMLYFSPQIWCSDNTDAYSRLAIQEGTSLIYPLSAMGAHVSVCPNHEVGRVTPFETRAIIASLGTFGYELDITKLSQSELDMVPGQIARYKSIQRLIQTGDYYRLLSSREGSLDAQMVVSRDRSRAVVTVVRGLDSTRRRAVNLKLKGLDHAVRYRVVGTDKCYSGDALTYLGLPVTLAPGDFKAVQVELVRAD